MGRQGRQAGRRGGGGGRGTSRCYDTGHDGKKHRRPPRSRRLRCAPLSHVLHRVTQLRDSVSAPHRYALQRARDDVNVSFPRRDFRAAGDAGFVSLLWSSAEAEGARVAEVTIRAVRCGRLPPPAHGDFSPSLSHSSPANETGMTPSPEAPRTPGICRQDWSSSTGLTAGHNRQRVVLPAVYSRRPPDDPCCEHADWQAPLPTPQSRRL